MSHGSPQGGYTLVLVPNGWIVPAGPGKAEAV